MTDEELLKFSRRIVAGVLNETGSTVTRACAALVRLSAPDDVDDAYVPRAAVVDIAMGLKRDMDAILSRSAAGGGPNG